MRLAIFDLDGTLVDSAPDLHAALDRLMNARGLPGFARPEVTAMIGDGARALVTKALAARGRDFDEAALDAFLHDYEAHTTDHSAPFPGIEAALDRLATQGWRLAVCTNKPGLATARMLEALGLAGRFPVVVGGDALPVRKPDPGHVRGVLAACGATPGEAVMIGDHRNDVLAAQGAGVASVFCEWGYGQGVGATARCATPADLPDLLAGMLGAA
ncbi:MAG: phosphoglycolate phosphatase [Acetobacteraceae bacterium]|nr:phosphoglycolate phosphatase [Acetobacteraceae bacterium]